MIVVKRLIFSQLTFWLVVWGLCLYSLFPFRDKIRLGMDLAGGTYLTLEVQTDKAIEAELVEHMQTIEKTLKAAGKSLPKTKIIENNKIVFSYDTLQNAQHIALFIKDEVKDLQVAQQDNNITFAFAPNKMKIIREEAVNRNIAVLHARLDPYGTAEIPVARQGDKNIIIELPDVANTLEAKSRIGQSAQLDFRIVEKTASTKEQILYDFDGELPPGKEILPGKDPHKSAEEYYLVPKYTDMSGKFLKTVTSTATGGELENEPAVIFTLNAEGATRFHNLTSKNIGRYVAIVLDGVVISAGRINSAIRDKGSICGGFNSTKQTQELALLLQSGSYSAPVTFEEERTIGPSLGYESIQKGFLSCMVGLLLILLFSLYYYSLSGLFAFLALVFNLVLILFGLSLLHSTLTLPGIAGMVLTVGMAVDASILIYEHIKEELKRGVATKQAVKAGFADAMKVILDANITTFIVGLVLYNTGSGPIQGFAVTMMLGIVATLITGLFFLRSIFSFVLDNFTIHKLRI